jgi:invasion protein IalB
MMISRHIRQCRSVQILFCAASLSLLLPDLASAQQAQPDIASRGQRSLVRPIKYGDWHKFCFKAAGSNQVCRTTISGNFDTGQSAIRADLIEREGEAKARLQIFLPVGMYLQAGVKLTVDQGKPRQIPYMWCLTNTCIAANVADAALVREMEKGQKLNLEVVDSSVQSVNTTLPLGEFASVHQGAPARIFEQDIDE